jgi:hypothetical protein
VDSNSAVVMDVCDCCVLSSRGLCDKFITSLKESYRLLCVVVFDLETLRTRRSWPALGRSEKKVLIGGRTLEVMKSEAALR